MKNTLTDLNNHLFAQIERLSDEKITPDKLEMESIRTRNITDVARQVISNAQLVLDAQVQIHDIPEQKELPKILK